jgi:hypothetical protein
MSDTTTTPETLEVPTTPVTESTESFTQAAEVSLAGESTPQVASTDASVTPAAEPTEENPSDFPPATDANTVDLNSVTHEDVINRIMDATKKMTFELLLALKLNEHILIRDGVLPTEEVPAPTQDETPAVV